MTGLILETSTEKGLVALCRNGRVFASHSLLGGAELSRVLARETDALLKQSEERPSFIAVGTGPGSYTGIRVGAALAKALAFGWKIPLFGFCSLEAFVPNSAQPYAVLIDARMGGFYALRQNEEAPELLSVEKAQESLCGISLFSSPHPEIIRQRLPLEGIWRESAPDPCRLALHSHRLFLQGNPSPLRLSYLSS